jgi:plasmid stabilization system protein ParE
LARLIYSGQALKDIERLADFLLATDPVNAAATVGLIEDAILVLRRHPLIGRPVESGMRELVISRGRSGYLALYAYDAGIDVAFILAIRHQREAGYSEPGADGDE